MIHRHVTARHARRFRYAMPPAIQKRTLVRSVLGGWWIAASQQNESTSRAESTTALFEERFFVLTKPGWNLYWEIELRRAGCSLLPLIRRSWFSKASNCSRTMRLSVRL